MKPNILELPRGSAIRVILANGCNTKLVRMFWSGW